MTQLSHFTRRNHSVLSSSSVFLFHHIYLFTPTFSKRRFFVHFLSLLLLPRVSQLSLNQLKIVHIFHSTFSQWYRSNIHHSLKQGDIHFKLPLQPSLNVTWCSVNQYDNLNGAFAAVSVAHVLSRSHFDRQSINAALTR